MPLKTTRGEEPGLNLTPMIDVVFLLNIFFLVATTLPRPERDLDVELPQVAAAGALSEAPAQRVVNVHRDGHITLDGRDVSLDELTHKLTAARSQYADLGVQVRGDALSYHQRVAEVLQACKQAGIRELGISVAPKQLR
jgi:biopolymer transport protein ExbD